MINDVDKLLEAAGNKGRYQYTVLILAFAYWVVLYILPISLSYLEKKTKFKSWNSELNKFENVTLDYSICNTDKNRSYLNNTLERSGHSWVIEFDIECDQVKTGLIGSFTFFGVLFGSFLFQSLPDAIGRKNTIILSSVLFSIIMILFNFVHNIVIAYLMVFLLEIFASLGLLCIFMFSSELSSIELRSLFGVIIHSGSSVSGVMFIMLFKYFDNWRLNFNIASGSAIIVTFFIIIYVYESPRYYSSIGYYKNMKESLEYIAKYNGKENEFFEFYLNYSNQIEKKGGGGGGMKVNKIKIEVDCSNDTEKKYHDEEETLSLKLPVVNNDNSTSFELICLSKQQTFLSLIKYSSIRTTFLINCYLWFSCSGIYYGLSINIKNIPGDLYFNGIFIYVSEIFAYLLSGCLINLPQFGRKKSMILFELISLSGYLSLIIFQFDNYTKTLLFFISRFAISGVYNILYIYSIEVYPTVVRAKGFGFNSICARIAGILFPLFIELLGNTINLVFFVVNLISLILIFLLPETYGKPLEDYIKV